MFCAALIQSSLRDYRLIRLSNPAINRWAILKRPSGTGKRRLSIECLSSIMARATSYGTRSVPTTLSDEDST